MSSYELSAAQQKVIEALLAGKTVTEAAKVGEVNRTTVHRWMNELPFELALSRGRREMREATRARLMALGNTAIDTVEQAIKEGDANAALAVLKGLGWFSREQEKN